MRLFTIPIMHSALAEAMQVGRCYEQVALAFNQLLIHGKKGYLTWVYAKNSEPTERLKSARDHSFIILDKVGGEEIKTWKSGLLFDPMDNKVASLKDCVPQLIENLARIINQPNKEQIQLSTNLIASLPLKEKHHELLAKTLKMLKSVLKGYFFLNWHLYWPEMKKKYPCLKERMVKVWLEKLWDILTKKIDIHATMANKLHLDELQDSITRLEQRFEMITSTEMLPCLNKQIKNG